MLSACNVGSRCSSNLGNLHQTGRRVQLQPAAVVALHFLSWHQHPVGTPHHTHLLCGHWVLANRQHGDTLFELVCHRRALLHHSVRHHDNIDQRLRLLLERHCMVFHAEAVVMLLQGPMACCTEPPRIIKCAVALVAAAVATAWALCGVLG